MNSFYRKHVPNEKSSKVKYLTYKLNELGREVYYIECIKEHKRIELINCSRK